MRESQAEARNTAIEAVRKITSSCLSSQSSSKSLRGGGSAGDWDPTYDGFLPMRSDTKGILGPGDQTPTQVGDMVTAGTPGETPTALETFANSKGDPSYKPEKGIGGRTSRRPL